MTDERLAELSELRVFLDGADVIAELVAEVRRLKDRLNHQTEDDVEACRQGRHRDCGRPRAGKAVLLPVRLSEAEYESLRAETTERRAAAGADCAAGEWDVRIEPDPARAAIHPATHELKGAAPGLEWMIGLKMQQNAAGLFEVHPDHRAEYERRKAVVDARSQPRPVNGSLAFREPPLNMMDAFAATSDADAPVEVTARPRPAS